MQRTQMYVEFIETILYKEMHTGIIRAVLPSSTVTSKSRTSSSPVSLSSTESAATSSSSEPSSSPGVASSAPVEASATTESTAGTVATSTEHCIKARSTLGRRLISVSSVKRARWTLGLETSRPNWIHVMSPGIDLAQLFDDLDSLVFLVRGFRDCLWFSSTSDNECLETRSEGRDCGSFPGGHL